MNNPNLILIRGLPGSGKTTLAEQLSIATEETFSEFVSCFEADHYFMVDGEYKFDRNKLRQAHAWCQEETRKALENGYTVIVSNTFTTLREMKPYFEMIQAHGKQPTVYVCQSQWGSIHDVPEDVMKAMGERFQYDLSSLFALLPE